MIESLVMNVCYIWTFWTLATCSILLAYSEYFCEEVPAKRVDAVHANGERVNGTLTNGARNHRQESQSAS